MKSKTEVVLIGSNEKMRTKWLRWGQAESGGPRREHGRPASLSCLVLLYINDINGGCVIVQEGLIVHIIYKHQFFSDNTFYLSLLPSNVQLLICQCVCVPALYCSNVHVHIRPDLQKKGWFQRQREAQSFIPVCWRLIRSLILCLILCRWKNDHQMHF